MSDTDPNAALIAGIAGAVGLLIKMIADMTGEPVSDVTKRVLAQVAADAANPSDETDPVVEIIDRNMPG